MITGETHSGTNKVDWECVQSIIGDMEIQLGIEVCLFAPLICI